MPGARRQAQPAAQPLSEASLPTAPDKLLQIADEQFDKGGAGVENSVTALTKALKDPAWAQSQDAYGAYWRLARAYAELSDTDNADRKAKMSDLGLQTGRKAAELGPDKVEGHYYLAQDLGYSAQAHKGDKELVTQALQQGEKAVQIDDKFDHGGPLRMLGAMYAKAPAPPLSIGDPEKAVKLLQQAVQVDGSYPANQIYLADALIADERYQDADAALKSARGLLTDKRWERNHAAWTAELNRVERKLRAKQG